MKVGRDAVCFEGLGLVRPSAGDQRERRLHLADHFELLGPQIRRHEAENARVAIRNVRRDAMQTLKDMVKGKKISEDDERRAHEKVQKLTDDYVAKADEGMSKKEKELMEV